MKYDILSLYKSLIDVKTFDSFPDSWELENPYINYWDRFEFFIDKFYSDFKQEESRNLIIGLNPGRMGCNKTGIAFTDENTLVNKLGYKSLSGVLETEGTATKIFSMIQELYEFDDFFSKYFLTNVFPFGVVEDGRRNVKFRDIMKHEGAYEFSKEFIKKSIDMFNPKGVICIGRGSESFMRKNFSELPIAYLHHPAYTFPEEQKENYRQSL